MPVFDDIPRTNSAPAVHQESVAAFLNRVDTPYFEELRDLIERWWDHLPDGNTRADIAGRLRSDDNRHFISAFWEVYLHESLIRAGYIVTCHPEIDTTRRRPDFLVTSDEPFYLEARIASESGSDGDLAAQRRRGRVYDALNDLDSPNFFLWIDVEGEGRLSPPVGGLRKELAQWLATLDPDVVSASMEAAGSLMSLPSWEWQSKDWHLVFYPIPKSIAARGKPGLRPVGTWGSGRGRAIDDVSPLRKALETKGKAYGPLKLPFVVAICADSLTLADYDVAGALYGSPQVRTLISPSGDDVAFEARAADGYFHDTQQWKHENVSGALIIKGLEPWTVGTEIPTLWEHPHADRPVVAPPMWRRNAADPATGEQRTLEPSLMPPQLFGLPKLWPPGEPFPA